MLGLLVAALVAAGALVLALLPDGRNTNFGSPGGRRGEIVVQPSLVPRIVQFGDTLTARIDVTVDSRRIDADSVRIQQEFLPWSVIRKSNRERRDAQATTFLRETYVLRCVISPCVPPRDTAPLEFNPVRITYRRAGGKAVDSATERWPLLVVHTNLVRSDLERRGAVARPWRADLLSFPVVSYSVSPGLLRPTLLAFGSLLALAAVVLAFLAIPHKEPEPESEPEPELDLSPLEKALALLTAEARSDGAPDRRRALELVSEEMEERGELLIARRARTMAWSHETPTVVEARELAESVRAHLASVEDEVWEPEEDHAPAR